MRLLVTRPEPDAAALADELLALGHEPVVQPLLEFQPLDFDPAPLKAAGALIVTSRNGLRALQGRIDPGAIAGCPVFCVGGETERGLRQAGFQTIAAVAETAEQLGRRRLQKRLRRAQVSSMSPASIRPSISRGR